MIEIVYWDEDTADDPGPQRITAEIPFEAPAQEIHDAIERHLHGADIEIYPADGSWEATVDAPDYIGRVRTIVSHWRSLEGYTVIRDLGD